MVLGPTRVHNPNGTSIGSAVFAWLTIVTDRQTDHCVTIGRIYVRIVMRSRNEFQCHMLHQRTYTLRIANDSHVTKNWKRLSAVFTARYIFSVCGVQSVCLLQVGVLSKWRNISSCKQRQGLWFSDAKRLGDIPIRSFQTGAPNTRGQYLGNYALKIGTLLLQTTNKK